MTTRTRRAGALMASAVVTAVLSLSPATAGEADVLDVEATRVVANQWQFAVTIRHADDGWKHYADGFDVLAPDGTVLGQRTLYHPHLRQPFNRMITGVEIPRSIKRVTVRAHDSVHGHGGTTVDVDLDW